MVVTNHALMQWSHCVIIPLTASNAFQALQAITWIRCFRDRLAIQAV
jgi:hypothetical protein